MSKRSLTVAQKRLIIARSGGLCEYCKCPEAYSLKSFDFDHIWPESKGGPTSPENIAYACGGCNGHKHAKTQAIDPESGLEANLFNPRQDPWEAHFAWSDDGLTIVGLTPTGRATVQTLQLNRRGVVNIRRLLILEENQAPD
jgi:5-methylcytosine-specific restriction endonuclease McrA